jgi:hypothetical protein
MSTKEQPERKPSGDDESDDGDDQPHPHWLFRARLAAGDRA